MDVPNRASLPGMLARIEAPSGRMWHHSCGVRSPDTCISPKRGLSKNGGKKNMTVRIRTEEFLRNGIRMYRVLNIRGALTKDRLDPQYVGSSPSFWLTDSHKTIRMFDGTTISINGEYRNSVFRKMLRAIETAGNRLHKINQEKYRAKKVREALQTKRESAKANDVKISITVFRI
jgi:hypothetical protein